jgi:SAM-dependent methyltransferase
LFDGVIRRRIKQAGLASYWLRRCLAPYSSQITSDQLVLDVGSGDSPYKDLWKHARYLAIDLTNQGADALGDICHLPVKSNSVDLVVCTEVLEHVFDTDKALVELNRVLKDGGRLVLSTPLIMGEHEAHDYYRFTSTCLAQQVQASGFEVVQVSKRGGSFSCLGLLLTHLPGQIIGKRGADCFTRLDCQRSARQLNNLWLYLALAFQMSLRVFVYLDRLDVKKHFTLGYVVLCSKRKCRV